MNDEILDSCLQTRTDNGTQPPVDSNTHKQRKWDQVIVDAEFNDLLSRYSEPYHKARLLAAGQRQHLPVEIGSTHFLSVRVVFTLKTTPFVWLSVSV